MLDLTGLPALDLAIGLAFIFFLLSTLAATIQEFIAAILGLRARTLEQGLRSLLEDPERGWAYVDEFYDHALIKSLYRTPPPAVLRNPKAKVAATSVQHRNAEAAAQTQPPQPAADKPMPNDKTGPPATGAQQEGAPAAGVGKNADTQLRGWFRRALAFFKRTNGPSYISPRAFALVLLDNVAPSDGQKTLFDESISVLGELPDSLGTRLKPLITDAQKDVERLRTNLEAWYDDTMARVSGWYKRKTQIILIVIGIVLVPAINANTIAMAERMWKDDTVRSAVVAQAQANASAKPSAGNRTLTDAANDVDKVVKVGIPMGWRGAAVPHGAGGIAMAIGGWVLTILAISLGAPFWFDTLSRFSRLRSSGKPETPLPAAGSGKTNERILTPPQVPTLVIQHEISPASGVDKPGHAKGGQGE